MTTITRILASTALFLALLWTLPCRAQLPAAPTMRAPAPAAAVPAAPGKQPVLDDSWRSDSRVTYYANEVHGQADQLRKVMTDLVAWQKSNWVAPRVCSGSRLSWTKTPPGTPPALYDCAPFQCTAAGTCRAECSANTDCAFGAKCVDTDRMGRNGVCVSP